jgi:hypothetical protein
MIDLFCPYLKRLSENRFYCEAKKKQRVDPALEPCLLSAWERANYCADYRKALLRDAAAKAATRAERIA